ncbi:galactose oxidase-like domain-containing protein [Streptomyces sp. NPDC056948]|uniref:galactose oxidase-like domain-containing protein n=1 Tax=Streptomyces sp. NPDC056948 TaxID=3345975 RepID=UPI003640FCAA
MDLGTHVDSHKPTFFDDPLVDPHAFIRAHEAVTAAFDRKRAVHYHECVDFLDHRTQQFDWFADLSRRLVHGDREARSLFREGLASDGAGAGVTADEDPPLLTAPAVSAAANSGRAESATTGQPVFNLSVLFDVFMGASYEFANDADLLARKLARLYAQFLEVALPVAALAHASAGFLDGAVDALGLARVVTIAAADQDVAGARGFSESGGRVVAEADDMLAAWLDGNPVDRWLESCREKENSTALHGVSPDVLVGGETLTLHADHGERFAKRQPEDVAVVFGPSAMHAEIRKWTSTEITVTVPERRSVDSVYFVRVPDERRLVEVEDSRKQFARRFGRHWGNSYLGVRSPVEFVPPQYPPVRVGTGLVVRHEPRLRRFAAYRDDRTMVQDNPVAGGETITVEWDVACDNAPLKEVRVSALGKNLWSGADPTGTLAFSHAQLTAMVAGAGESANRHTGRRGPGRRRWSRRSPRGGETVGNELRLEIAARNEVGTVRRTMGLTINIPALSVRPYGAAAGSPLTVWMSGGAGFLIVEASSPRPFDTEVALQSSDPGRVSVVSPITIPAGGTSAFTAVLGTGQPASPGPAATVTATAPLLLGGSVDVWVAGGRGRFEQQPTELDLVPIHAALLPNGKVLMMSSDEQRWSDPNNKGRGKYLVWDPATAQPVSTATWHTDDYGFGLRQNLFCSGHCLLGDGRLLVAGGVAGPGLYYFPGIEIYGSDITVHAARVHEGVSTGVLWTRFEDMPRPRWYPTCVTLPSGDGLIVAGSSDGSHASWINSTHEVFEQSSGTLHVRGRFYPDNIKTYPFVHVLPGPDGETVLFVYENNRARLHFPEQDLWSPPFPTTTGYRRTYDHQGSSVVLPIEPDAPVIRILVVGGQGPWSLLTPATDTAEIFEFDRADPMASRWRRTSDLEFRRYMADAVLLPDGNVLVTGGAEHGHAPNNWGPVWDAELFRTRDETFHRAARLNNQRRYHSVALLIPDGRVLAAGHTSEWNNDRDDMSVELYAPPYLWSGPRPAVDSAPSQISYGETFRVATANARDIASVSLVRASSVTHSNNMDQRHLWLDMLDRADDSVTVRAPAGGAWAPPGYYLLFVLDAHGVPSEGEFLKVAPRSRAGPLVLFGTQTQREADPAQIGDGDQPHHHGPPPA